MSIRIVPEGELKAAAGEIPPLLLPDPQTLYLARAERLEKLAEGHPMAGYLRFCARVARAQHALAAKPVPLPARDAYLAQCAEHALPPLAPPGWERDPRWQDGLAALLADIAPSCHGPAADAVARLQAMDHAEVEAMADALLAGRFGDADPAAAPLVWAALSVYYSTQATQLKVTAKPEPGDARELCPVCHQAPVASVVRIGDKAGLRYLHCTLCESEWHYVRAQCSACESSRDIGLWTLDDARAAVRAETCGECNSYLKLMALDIDHRLEPVADDLATLALDAAVEEKGYARSAINPFLFPAH